MSLVVAQKVPTSSTMALPHGPTGVGTARRRLRAELTGRGAPESVVDDAVLVLSELLSNSCRHARPLDEPLDRETAEAADGDGSRNGGRSVSDGPGRIRAGWWVGEDGLLTLEVTDGGGPTRPMPSSPSLTARGGRGLGIVAELALDWGVRDDAPGEVTVWAVLPIRARHARRDGFTGGLVTRLRIAAVADAVDCGDL